MPLRNCSLTHAAQVLLQLLDDLHLQCKSLIIAFDMQPFISSQLRDSFHQPHPSHASDASCLTLVTLSTLTIRSFTPVLNLLHRFFRSIAAVFLHNLEWLFCTNLFFCKSIFMVALWNTANHYIFVLWFLSSLCPPCVADADIVFLPCDFYLSSSFFP